MLDPVTGDGVRVFISLAGADSAIHRKATATLAKRRLSSMKGFRYRSLHPEKFESEGIEVLAACTLDWKGVVVDGAPLPCSRDNAIQLYTRFPWLREQVDQFVSDRSAYLQD